MILGKIIGKTTTLTFKFLVNGDAKKFQYIQALSEDNKYLLAQITELEREQDTTAHCIVLGYREKNILRKPLKPLKPNTEILLAEPDFIKQTLGLQQKTSGYIGLLDNYNIKVHLDLNNIITKHLAILAKSGSGKTYCVSTILEELLEKKVPVLIIDPHGEYSSLKSPNPKDKEAMQTFNIKPKAYADQIQEYTPTPEYNTDAIPLKLSLNNTQTSELTHLLPAKLSNSQFLKLLNC